MITRESHFFEEHIEKIVLAAVGVVCVFLLVVFVIFSPTKVTYDNKKFTPLEIDEYISDKKANELEHRLNREPSIVGPYESKEDDFNRLMASSIDIRTDIYPQIPANLKDVGIQPKYALPEMVEVMNAAVDVLSVVAYLPKGTISEDNVYSRLNSEPNDLDLVTVEAEFDVKELYRRFKEQFAGSNVKPEWRDGTLGIPVFAAVQLQRKEQLKDDNWSDWVDVPRSRIDSRKERFGIVENVRDLPPGGIKVRLLDFKDKQVQVDLLQPEVYRIASSDEQWFPPSLHSKYKKYQEELQRLEQIESRTNEAARRKTVARGDDADMALAEEMTRLRRLGGATDQVTSAKIREVTESINELSDGFKRLSITENADLSELEEPMLVWAFDDTIEQKKKYRYRIRVGVFNPIAGTEKFVNANDPKRNTVILWSNYAEAEEVLSVPGRLYFFARDVQKAEKAVTVTVCRKTLGYWYTKDFMVKPGEKIGKSVKLSKTEIEEAESTSPGTTGLPDTYLGATVVSPAVVDYSTDAILIDVVDVNDWAGRANLYERYYTEMLYSYDGAKIYRMPIKQDYWPAELRTLFSEVRQSKKEAKEPLRPWSDIRSRGRRQVTTQPQTGDDDERLRIWQQMMRERALRGGVQQ
jgi:hypothetical protein